MAGPRDAAALQVIDAARAHRLLDMRARAEKWIAGLAALVTAVTAAFVVKGPQSYNEIDKDARLSVLGLLLFGALAIVIGLIAAYSAAFGGVFGSSKVEDLLAKKNIAEDGAAAALENAATDDMGAARNGLRLALAMTSAGAVLLAAGVAVAWVNPKAPSSTTVCATIGGQDFRFDGAPSIESGTVEFTKCPK